jgi:medium-chain acyl-[acyl-carrier-protein] hydrolase
MSSLYQTSLTIPPYEIDFSNRMRLSAFFHAMQSTASEHAEQWGLGLNGLQSHGILWVLSWLRIEVQSYPQYRDEISITTWPQSRHRIFSLRDFLFRTPTGEVLGRARSAWLVVDRASMRATSLDRLPHPVPYLETEQALAVLPEKLPVQNGGEVVFEKRVSYSDLDLYRHVNNARYVEYLMDSYPLDFHRAHTAAALTITFNAESRHGDHLLLKRSSAAETPLRHHITARKEGEEHKLVFQAQLDWKTQ